jgi:hypothetical protein
MSEVDRLSNSGLYPALPIADKRSRKDKDGSGAERGLDKAPNAPDPKAAAVPDPNQPRPPKSLIDEYA